MDEIAGAGRNSPQTFTTPSEECWKDVAVDLVKDMAVHLGLGATGAALSTMVAGALCTASAPVCAAAVAATGLGGLAAGTAASNRLLYGEVRPWNVAISTAAAAATMGLSRALTPLESVLVNGIEHSVTAEMGGEMVPASMVMTNREFGPILVSIQETMQSATVENAGELMLELWSNVAVNVKLLAPTSQAIGAAVSSAMGLISDSSSPTPAP